MCHSYVALTMCCTLKSSMVRYQWWTGIIQCPVQSLIVVTSRSTMTLVHPCRSRSVLADFQRQRVVVWDRMSTRHRDKDCNDYFGNVKKFSAGNFRAHNPT